MREDIELAIMRQHDFLVWALAMHPKELRQWKKEYQKFEEEY